MAYIDVSDIIDETPKPVVSRTYKIDFERGRINGMIDGLDAVSQTVVKMLMTPRFRHLIYNNQYGSEIISAMRDSESSREFFETDLPRLVKDSLKNDSRVLDITDFSFRYEGENVIIGFTAVTIYGNTKIQGVI